MSAADLEKLGRGFSAQLLARVKGSLGEEWDALPADAAEKVKANVADRAALTLRALGGEDVAAELAVARATSLNWTFVGSSRALAAIEAAAKDVAEFVLALLMGVAKAAL